MLTRCRRAKTLTHMQGAAKTSCPPVDTQPAPCACAVRAADEASGLRMPQRFEHDTRPHPGVAAACQVFDAIANGSAPSKPSVHSWIAYLAAFARLWMRYLLVRGKVLKVESSQCTTRRRSRHLCSGDNICMNRGDPAPGLVALSVAGPRTKGRYGAVYEAL